MESDGDLLLLDFCQKQDAIELYEMLSRIHDDIFTYYYFTLPRRQLRKHERYEAANEQHDNRVTVKKVISDVKFLVASRVSNVIKKTSSVVSKGLGDKISFEGNKRFNKMNTSVDIENPRTRRLSTLNRRSESINRESIGNSRMRSTPRISTINRRSESVNREGMGRKVDLSDIRSETPRNRIRQSSNFISDGHNLSNRETQPNPTTTLSGFQMNENLSDSISDIRSNGSSNSRSIAADRRDEQPRGSARALRRRTSILSNHNAQPEESSRKQNENCKAPETNIRNDLMANIRNFSKNKLKKVDTPTTRTKAPLDSLSKKVEESYKNNICGSDSDEEDNEWDE